MSFITAKLRKIKRVQVQSDKKSKNLHFIYFGTALRTLRTGEIAIYFE